MRLNFQLSHPCEMDSGGSYVHGDTDFVSIIPTREGWVVQVLETILKRSHVSIIPTHEGWVRKYLITIPIRSSFNHPSPRGLGRCSYIYSFKQKIVFQSSKPARAGAAVIILSTLSGSVSIIPTREGWVQLCLAKSTIFIAFQSSQPRVLGLHVIMHRNPDNGFNHPSPRGLGSDVPVSLAMRCSVFQSSQPAGVGSLRITCC